MNSNVIYAIAVIIATKNRADALSKYALRSLARSLYRKFVCVVWDASDDESSRKVIDGEFWPFSVIYCPAPRAGSSSQRNDAVDYVLASHPEVKYIVFIDDDCELSEDALQGVFATFQEKDARIVNIPMRPLGSHSKKPRTTDLLKRFLGMNRHGAFPFLYNYGDEDEASGIDIEWASGGGMAVDITVFRDENLRFPEAFQRFGGYALGEDFAFSYFVFKKLGKRIVNSVYGHFLHYAAGSARLDIERMAASKWYNFHLLFDAIYDDVGGLKKWWLKLQFKVFMCGAALKLLIRARSLDIFSVLKGIGAARSALREYHQTEDIRTLIRKNNPVEDCE